MVLIRRLPQPPPDYNQQHRIYLGKNLFAIVDAEDLPWLIHYDWRAIRSNANYYAARRYIRDGKCYTIRMHRQIMSCPAGLDVHHINHNSLDNRKSNLLIITKKSHEELHNHGSS